MKNKAILLNSIDTRTGSKVRVIFNTDILSFAFPFEGNHKEEFMVSNKNLCFDGVLTVIETQVGSVSRFFLMESFDELIDLINGSQS